MILFVYSQNIHQQMSKWLSYDYKKHTFTWEHLFWENFFFNFSYSKN